VPTLLVVFAFAGGVAYLISQRSKPASAATAAPAPSFWLRTAPPSPPLPNHPKYTHTLGTWCSYAGTLPIYFCGANQAACEAAGRGSVCIEGGPTLWCLERFDPADSLDKADCFWSPQACRTGAAKEKLESRLRVDCTEYARR
jgi:hypothetical protein